MELEWSRKNSRPICHLLGLIVAKSRKYFGHGIHHDGSVEQQKKIGKQNVADRLIGWT